MGKGDAFGDEKGAWTSFTSGMTSVFSTNKKPAERRRKLEKPLIPAGDGRRKRATGRSAVFNTKLQPWLREELFEEAHRRGIAVSALLEIVWKDWKGGQRGGG